MRQLRHGKLLDQQAGVAARDGKQTGIAPQFVIPDERSESRNPCAKFWVPDRLASSPSGMTEGRSSLRLRLQGTGAGLGTRAALAGGRHGGGARGERLDDRFPHRPLADEQVFDLVA